MQSHKTDELRIILVSHFCKFLKEEFKDLMLLKQLSIVLCFECWKPDTENMFVLRNDEACSKAFSLISCNVLFVQI